MLEVTHRASVVSRSQSALTDEEALKILFQANTPNPPGSWSPGGCATPASSRSFTPGAHGVTILSPGGRGSTSGRNSSRRRRGRQSSNLAETPPKEDEEAVNSRKFWENWAVEATHQLLSDLKDEQEETKEPIFSGRCGPEPKFYSLQRSESQESLQTDISLFNCSELNNKDSSRRSRKNSKKRKSGKMKVPEVNWEMFSRERKGVLDRLIQADASQFEGYMANRTAPVQNVVQRVKATDVMSKYERRMLMKCAYGRGLHLANNNKSGSTENIVSVARRAQLLPDCKAARGVTWEADGTRADSCHDGCPGGESDEAEGRGAPSPADIVQGLTHRRPESATPALHPLEDSNSSSRVSSAASSRLSWGGVQRTMPSRSVRYDAASPALTMHTLRQRRKHSTAAGLPDLEGVFSNKVKRRIQHTINHLNKATGFGDRTDVSVPIPEEQGVYTDADYARHPRYPQNIRIAPHLSKVICDDIRDRMGRPRRHEVRVADLQAYDAEQPELGRSHRNLHIFNWLNSVSEGPYDDRTAPDIADLEGDSPKRTYPSFKPGIVGYDDVDSLPTATSGQCLGDDSGSDLSRSDFDSDDSFYD